MSLLLTATVVALVPSALGHGYMLEPPARQLPVCNDRSITSKFAQGAGTGGGMNGFTLGGEPGLCGDPFKNKGSGDPVASTFVDLPCQKERKVYTEGTTLDMEWMVTANHGGFFECKICDDANNLSEECFNKWPLLTVEHNDPRWWIMTPESSRVHDNNTPPSERGHVFKWSWHLPMGLTCEHCVVQCTWPSATHCVFPCEREVCGWYADQYNHIMRPPGASNYQHVTGFCKYGLKPPPDEAPQIFRNCGDITIVPSGANGPAGDAAPLSEPKIEPTITVAPQQASDTDADPPAATPAVVESAPEPTTSFTEWHAAFVEEKASEEGFPTPSSVTVSAAPPMPSPGGGVCGMGGQPVCSGAQLTGRDYECDHGYVGEGGVCVPQTPEEDAKNKEMMSEEEEYEIDTFSPAGNMLSCDDKLVSSVFQKINISRGYNNSPQVVCSEKATGAAEAWAEAMCMSGEEITDRANNCRLAGYSDACSEMVTMTSEARPFNSLPSGDMDSLRKLPFTSVGVGYAVCGDSGEKAWVLLFDGPGSTAPASALE